MNKKAIIDNKELQLGDVEGTLADIIDAREQLKYAPKYSIDKGLDEYLKWFIDYTK